MPKRKQKFLPPTNESAPSLPPSLSPPNNNCATPLAHSQSHKKNCHRQNEHFSKYISIYRKTIQSGGWECTKPNNKTCNTNVWITRDADFAISMRSKPLSCYFHIHRCRARSRAHHRQNILTKLPSHKSWKRSNNNDNDNDDDNNQLRWPGRRHIHHRKIASIIYLLVTSVLRFRPIVHSAPYLWHSNFFLFAPASLSVCPILAWCRCLNFIFFFSIFVVVVGPISASNKIKTIARYEVDIVVVSVVVVVVVVVVAENDDDCAHAIRWQQRCRRQQTINLYNRAHSHPTGCASVQSGVDSAVVFSSFFFSFHFSPGRNAFYVSDLIPPRWCLFFGEDGSGACCIFVGVIVLLTSTP